MARFDLRVPTNQIGLLNLKQYAALIARKKESDNRERFNAAMVLCAVLNSAPGDPNRKPATPLDFIPDWQREAEENAFDLRKLSPEEQKNYIFSMFGKCVQKKR